MDIARDPLKTARLSLDPLGAAHADELWRVAQASVAELRPWLSWAGEGMSRGVMDAFATEAERAWRAGEQYVFAVVLDDAPIGACDVRRVSSRLPIGEIGYWVGSAHSSKGYMSEAACAVRDFGFDALRLDRIQLRAGVGNAASRRIAAKLGFRQEGLLRHGTGGGDGPYDCYLYGMLASDPRPSI